MRLARINTLFHHLEKYRHPWELLAIPSLLAPRPPAMNPANCPIALPLEYGVRNSDATTLKYYLGQILSIFGWMSLCPQVR